MGERKGVNKYYPPDFDPSKGGLNKYHGTHALRERARKLPQGILIIRFEMPYNIWCNGCGNHIGMGVRYNAEKRKMGNYYTTPIYKFRMKCHLCDQHFEIQTDPKNCDYLILSGCRRKEERWDTEKAGNVQTTEREVKEKMMTNAMYKLEHSAIDKGKVKKLAPTLSRLEEIRDDWKDDFSVNQLLRKKFREEKKEMLLEMKHEDDLKRRMNLPSDLKLLKEMKEDKEKAMRIRYGINVDAPDVFFKSKRKKVKESSIFGKSVNIKKELAHSLANKCVKSHADGSPIKANSNLNALIKKVVKAESVFGGGPCVKGSTEIQLQNDLCSATHTNHCGSTNGTNHPMNNAIHKNTPDDKIVEDAGTMDKSLNETNINNFPFDVTTCLSLPDEQHATTASSSLEGTKLANTPSESVISNPSNSSDTFESCAIHVGEHSRIYGSANLSIRRKCLLNDSAKFVEYGSQGDCKYMNLKNDENISDLDSSSECSNLHSSKDTKDFPKVREDGFHLKDVTLVEGTSNDEICSKVNPDTLNQLQTSSNEIVRTNLSLVDYNYSSSSDIDVEQ